MGLLSFLFGHHPAQGQGQVPQSPNMPPPQMGAPAPKWGYDGQGYLVPGDQAVQPPPQALQTPAPQQAPPQAQAPSGPPDATGRPMDVVGQRPDDWKPHHASVLGQVADYILGTHFGKENTRRNMEAALQNISTNPMQAVHRMAQFDPVSAEDLYDKVTDNQRQAENLQRQNRVYDGMNENVVFGRMSSMMSPLSGANESNWQPRRKMAIQMAVNRGIDASVAESMIPEQFDPDASKTMAYGGVPSAKQMTIASQDANHQQQHRDRQASLAERTTFHQGELAQGTTRLGLQGRSVATGEMNAQTAAERARIYAQNNGGGVVQQSPDGSALVPDKSGKTAIRFMKDGRKALYIRGPDGHHWRFSHQMIARDEKAAGVISAPEVDDIPDE